MADSRRFRRPALQAHLLGTVDYQRCLALQERLVYEAGGSDDGRITLLICEHQGLITVGRSGSRAQIHCDSRELASRQLCVRWINRGGGCVLHTPGQLAIYPIVPLANYGWTPGEYAHRLQEGLVSALAEVGIAGHLRGDGHGVFGRSGLLTSLGIAVKNWIAYHGAFVNVAPAMHLLRLVDADPQQHVPSGSLVAERQQPVKITAVRAALLRSLTEALGCDRYHPHSGHPLLSSPPGPSRAIARVG